MFIVLNPPAVPPPLRLVSRNRADRAVEIAIRVARLDFHSPANTPPMEWLKVTTRLTRDAAFVLRIPGGELMPLMVVDARDAQRMDWSTHNVVEGAAGVLELAALLAVLVTR